MRGEFTAILERDGDWYIGYCPEIPGANGQGRTPDECRASLADAIALIYDNIAGGFVVHEDAIAANVRRELPFLMTENLMMEGVRRGGDRQVLHERVRIHAQSHPDDLFDRIAGDPLFGIDRAAIESMARPDDYTGLARQQTERFLVEDVDPILSGQVIDAPTEALRV